MDHKLEGFLKHYVLAFMLLEVQWSLTDSAAIPASCADLNRTKDLSNLLRHEAKILLRKYEHVHFESRNGSLPGYVDNFTISGANLSEKLQRLLTNNELFNLHISRAEEYQAIWANNEIVMKNLSMSDLKSRLRHQSNIISHILKKIYPESPSAPTPPPLQLTHTTDYAKKLYGWNVIVTLRDYQKKVIQVIEELFDHCAAKRN
ncbi:uncharacterized protein [Channa argus]|uniref:uncharacterized protein n=1 Tax=Channa argus TaxID=215402 RepID=UPI0029453625|nr:hypothetical protein Q8A73_011507 [Channa argus]